MKITYIKRLPQMSFGGEEIKLEQENIAWDQAERTLRFMRDTATEALKPQTQDLPEQPEDSIPNQSAQRGMVFGPMPPHVRKMALGHE